MPTGLPPEGLVILALMGKDTVDSLLAALASRIRGFTQSGDPSELLDPGALHEARKLWEAAQGTYPGSLGVPPDVLEVIAHLHLARYQVLPEGQGDPDGQTAISLFIMLMDQFPERLPEDVRKFFAAAPTQSAAIDDTDRLIAAGNSALNQYRYDGRSEMLDAALKAYHEAVSVVPLDHPSYAGCLSNLASALCLRFERDGNGADLDEAIDLGRRSVAAAPPGHPGRASFLTNLCGSLVRRFERSGNVADLDAGIDAGQQAVAATPPGASELAGILSNLAVALSLRFQCSADGADLDAAIDVGRQAVAATRPGHPRAGMYLSVLSGLLLERFNITAHGADIDEAIDVGQQAVTATPAGYPSRARCLANLAASLGARFEQTGNAADVDAAIDAGRQAIEITPQGDPGLTGIHSNLGSSLRNRFQLTGNAPDLDAAIDAGREAVAAAQPGNPRLGTMLSVLGDSLRDRFDLSGDSTDLDAAIDAGRRAIDTTPRGHPNHAMHLSSLASSLATRFERGGDSADLHAAIDAGQQAVAVTPPGHPNYGTYRSNLGGYLLTRFERNRSIADLDAAIDVWEQAVIAIPAGHPHFSGALSGLGRSLRIRFEQGHNTADLDAAIDAGQRAVAADPPGHPHRSHSLAELGNSLRTRFGRTGDRADLDAAIDCWRQASLVPAASARYRLAAARMWSAAAIDAGRTHEAAEGAAMAVQLLPTVAWHGLDRQTRAELLAQYAGVGCDAATCLVLDGRAESAVELLEQSRSVLWTQALNLRSDLTLLAEKAPDMAERLDRARNFLDRPVAEVIPSSPQVASGDASFGGRAGDAIELRRRMARDWDEILAQVRCIDGFEHFLAATPYQELAAALSDGPVVIVNVSRYGCHALIVRAGSEPVQVLSLPEVTPDATTENLGKMLWALAGTADPGRTTGKTEEHRHALLDVLDWAWDAISEPILTALGHTGPPNATEPWPQIQWCLTGPLTVLPIHAAGHHPRVHPTAATDRTDCVLDRVISSYTPTLNALRRARHQQTPTAVRHLGIGMPTTPYLPPLPAVTRELEVLAHHFPPGQDNQQLVQSRATRKDVLAAAATHSWVHMEGYSQPIL